MENITDAQIVVMLIGLVVAMVAAMFMALFLVYATCALLDRKKRRQQKKPWPRPYSVLPSNYNVHKN